MALGPQETNPAASFVPREPLAPMVNLVSVVQLVPRLPGEANTSVLNVRKTKYQKRAPKPVKFARMVLLLRPPKTNARLALQAPSVFKELSAALVQPERSLKQDRHLVMNARKVQSLR